MPGKTKQKLGILQCFLHLKRELTSYVSYSYRISDAIVFLSFLLLRSILFYFILFFFV
jgi:hypothetical protein